MSIQTILDKIIGIADNGLNTAAEMRVLLNEMVEQFSGGTSGTTFTSQLINDGDTGLNPFISINDVYGSNVVIDANYFHLQNYDYYTQANKWVINNKLSEIFISGVTSLGVAHPTLDRIDVIAIESGVTDFTFVVISGTPATIPSKPEVDETRQVELTFVLVKANTTAPSNVFETVIYDENLGTGNGEWNTSKVEEIPASNTIRLASSATTAYSGSTTIRFLNATSGDHVHFDNNILIDGTGISNLIFRIKVINAQPQFAETLSFAVRFYSNSGPDGTTVYITSGQYGFDATKLNVWQTIIIPSTVLGISSKFIDRIRLTNRRNNVEFFIDNMFLQSGTEIVSIPVIPTKTSDLINNGEDGINKFITNQDNISRLISVSYSGLTGATGYSFSNTLKQNLVAYLNDFGYEKLETDGDIWVEYDDSTDPGYLGVTLTYYMNQLEIASEYNGSGNYDYSNSFPWEFISGGITYTLNDSASYTADASGELVVAQDLATLLGGIPNITVEVVTPAGYDYDARDYYLLKFTVDIGLFGGTFEIKFSSLALADRYYRHTITLETNSTVTVESLYNDEDGINGNFVNSYGSAPFNDKNQSPVSNGNYSDTLFIE